jgi:hypothetical protein
MVLAISPVAMSFLTAAGIVVDGTLRPFVEAAFVVDRLLKGGLELTPV